MQSSGRRVIRLLLASSICWVALAATAWAAPNDYVFVKVAIGGETAPGTGGAKYANDFFSVALNDLGEVAYVDNLTDGAASWGGFLYSGSSTVAVTLQGDPAPLSGGGTYFFPGGFVALNDGGEVSFMAVVTGGSANSGIFADSSGTDMAVVVAGQNAPGTGSGTFDGSLSALNLHALNALGDVAFTDAVNGGTVGDGVFRYSAGGHAAVSLEGEVAPGTGGGVYDGFETPTMNDAGDVVFPALVVGGTAARGLFMDSGGAESVLALAGDPAPRTGGGSLDDFLYPVVNESGAVAFLSNVSGGSATGGLFVVSGGSTTAVVVENAPAPGTGGGTFSGITSLAALNDAGDVAFSGTVTGGDVAAGVFHFDAVTGQVSLVMKSGDEAPDAGGATFTQFGFVDLNESGQVATQSTLSDARLGLFLATVAASVPALSAPGLLVTFAGLLAGGILASRRRIRSAV